MKFKKKPIALEATQWFKMGDHPAVESVPYDHPVDGFAIKPGEWGWIRTLESAGHLVQPGDWIITGVRGEHYACKPDIFAETYEPAEEPDGALHRRHNGVENRSVRSRTGRLRAGARDSYAHGSREHPAAAPRSLSVRHRQH